MGAHSFDSYWYHGSESRDMVELVLPNVLFRDYYHGNKVEHKNNHESKMRRYDTFNDSSWQMLFPSYVEEVVSLVEEEMDRNDNGEDRREQIIIEDQEVEQDDCLTKNN